MDADNSILQFQIIHAFFFLVKVPSYTSASPKQTKKKVTIAEGSNYYSAKKTFKEI